MDVDADSTPIMTARRGNQLMTAHPRRGIRSVTVCQFVAFVLIGLLGMSEVSLGQTFEVVRSLVPAPNGVHPKTGLIQASDGSFYGTTDEGGTSGYGTVFKLDAAGTLTTLHSFNGSDVWSPSGLIQARDGSFYGTTSGGGTAGAGVIFRLRGAE